MPELLDKQWGLRFALICILAFNTLWEALAVLVAIKLWGPRRGRWVVWVRSDSLSTLLALSRSKAHSAGLSIIAREVALLRAELDLQLSRFVHVPGVADGWADALSRLMAPAPSAFPRALGGAPAGHASQEE